MLRVAQALGLIVRDCRPVTPGDATEPLSKLHSCWKIKMPGMHAVSQCLNTRSAGAEDDAIMVRFDDIHVCDTTRDGS
jgi:hypothetical protein